MFVLYANKNSLTVHQSERVTSGSVNAYDARFEFSPDWVNMTKRVVFRAGLTGKPLTVPWTGDDLCEIPWEVMTVPAVHIYVGIYGTRNETVVLPTVWADLGVVLEGVTTGRPAQSPTPDPWEQELAQKGDKLDYTEDGNLGLYAGEKLLSALPVPCSGDGGPAWGVGHGLKVVNGDLTVSTADNFAGDNTLPMTAAGVQAAVGNIEVLLGTI